MASMIDYIDYKYIYLHQIDYEWFWNGVNMVCQIVTFHALQCIIPTIHPHVLVGSAELIACEGN
jgi:hypothetical protein